MSDRLQPGGDCRTDWRAINRNSDRISSIERDLGAIDGLRRQHYNSGFALQTYRVKSKQDDVLFCVTWNGTKEGTELIPVAVNRSSQFRTSETINGVTYLYSDYTDIGDGFNYTRTSNDGSSEETQIVTPMYYINCEIDVSRTHHSGVLFLDLEADPNGKPKDLKLIEVSARCWAKIAEE